MSKVAVVYWSQTGNTEAMANSIVEGAKAAGAECDLYESSAFDAGKVADYDAFAFGCPAMGDEELEDTDFAPMWDSVKGELNGKTVILFGSYGWGDGDWMRTWESEAPCAIAKTYICNETPDDAASAECRALGAELAK